MSALLLLFLAGAPGAEDWLEVEAKLALPADAGRALSIGEPFQLVIEARHAPGRVALLPGEIAWPPSLGERSSARRHTRADGAGHELDRYTLELVAFEAGALTVPAVPLALGATTAQTLPLALEVADTFSETERPVASSTAAEALAELEKMAAQDPAAAPVLVPDARPWWGLLILGSAGLLAYLLWRLAARREARPVLAPPPPPPIPAHVAALERLEALRQAGYLERGEGKRFYVELSEILRAYVGARYGFDSLELTIAELMQALARVRARGLEVGKLELLLESADLVKFAKYAPSAAQAAEALDAAFSLVEKSRPEEAR